MMENDTITNCLLDEKTSKRYGATDDPHLEGGQRPVRNYLFQTLLKQCIFFYIRLLETHIVLFL